MKVTITADHYALLARMNFDWDDECEWGAVSSDPKRPFGKSGVPADVSEILRREVGYEEARRLSIELAALVQAIVHQAAVRAHTTGAPGGTELALPYRAARLLGGGR